MRRRMANTHNALLHSIEKGSQSTIVATIAFAARGGGIAGKSSWSAITSPSTDGAIGIAITGGGGGMASGEPISWSSSYCKSGTMIPPPTAPPP